MPRATLRILAYLALALAPFGSDAEAGVGDMSGGPHFPFARLSPVQTVQYGGDCWYDNGSNGPGYYPCGNEWNNGLSGAGPGSSIIVPPMRRHHRHGVVVARPQAPNPVYPGALAPHLGAGGAYPSAGLNRGASAFGGHGLRRFGAAGVRALPNFHAGAATGTPGFAGGNFHQFHGAGVPRIGGPASPGVAGVGTFHTGGAFGAPHVGAPASSGLAGGGFHGVGAGGAFQGGGIGRR
ncbi:MAG TPA: hypothetical protein VIJ63_22715 [Roseiarcus sp.]